MKTSKDTKRFLEALSEIPNISIACKKTGFSRQTIYRWKKIDKKFSDRLDAVLKIGIESICDLCESKLVEHIQAGNMRAISYYLDNNKREYLRPRRPIELSKRLSPGDSLDGIEINIIRTKDDIKRFDEKDESPNLLTDSDGTA